MRARYALWGALLSLWVPAGLVVVRALDRGRGAGWSGLSSDLANEQLTYGYVLLSSLALMAGLGFVFGRSLERALQMSVTDPLTGLFNRRHFVSRLSSAMVTDRRDGLATCVMCVDVDRLKAINDHFGHERGDAALVIVARALSQGLRSRDVVARFGGDEFAVLLPDTSGRSAVAIGERVLGALRGAAPGLPEGVSVSIGIAELSPSVTARELMVAADRALYWVKSTGGGRVSLAPQAAIGLPGASA